jgi:aspartate dehydrogenase
LPGGVTRFSGFPELIAAAPSLVVEAAGHDAVRSYAERVLEIGATLVCTSVGALAESRCLRRLEQVAAEHGGRIVVPSGGIGGLDVLHAAACRGLDCVEVEQRKPPSSLLPRNEAEQLTGPETLFSGSVVDAVRLYPKTTNVLAAVAFAGVGVERTRVSIVADPAVDGNQAAVRAWGEFGSFEFRITNRRSPNPQTSLVTALSVIASLQNLCSVLSIPG